MKNLIHYKLFENKENLKDMIEDLFGIDPHYFRDVITSIMDDMGFYDIEFLYIASIINRLRKKINTNDQNYSDFYALFIDDENGLHKQDYDKFIRYTQNEDDMKEMFSGAFHLLIHKEINKNRFDEIINYLEENIYNYGEKMKNVVIDRKKSIIFDKSMGTGDFLGVNVSDGFLIQFHTEN